MMILVAQIVFLIAALFFGLSALGTDEDWPINACVTLATLFACACVALIAFEVVYGR